MSSASIDPNIDAAIAAAIARLRRCSQLDLLPGWRGLEADPPVDIALDPQQWPSWKPMVLNGKGHVAWGDGRQVLWLGRSLRVPQALPDPEGYPTPGLALRLALRWWAEDAQVFVNGKLLQAGDIFDCFGRVLLSPAVVPGEVIHIALRLVSPGHDAGALVQSLALFEQEDAQLTLEDGMPGPEPGFVANEMAALQCYLEQFDPDALPTLAEALGQLPWKHINGSSFDSALAQLRRHLLPLGEQLRQRRMTLLGHAHLDLAWLWPIDETWEVAERTFESVLQLQDRFPELVFTHSTPALYAWLEAHRPALFRRICDRVQTGLWEVAAGLWVEPELTYVGGEAIARQVLYGQQYVRSRFGQYDRVAWLPDSFGFCGQLPQILRQGGIDYFATQKLRWNDTTTFPHQWFRWQAPDGSSVLGVNLPPIGTDIDPVAMATHQRDWEAATGHPDALWLPGVGDHGGGPTADMVQQVRRWQHSPFFPQLAFGQAQEFLDRLPRESLPTWTQDLYLEFHRGCYTTHPDQKRWNRCCERQLYEAELFAALASRLTDAPYPQSELTAAWKQVLFNQFHDILPGSAIRDVYEAVDPTWQQVAATATRITESAMAAIARRITRPAPPVSDAQPWAVFNSLNWSRGGVVSLPEGNWQAYDETGPLPCQQVDGRWLAQLDNIPGVGYRVIWLVPAQPGVSPTLDQEPPSPEYVLENEYLRVTLDAATGAIASLYDKQAQRQVLSGLGNQLQAFRDQGQYWDAWNIDPQYEQHPIPVSLVAIAWQAHGPLRQCVRVVQQVGESQIQQDYTLDSGSPQLTIHCQTHWQERHVLVKAAFPLALEAQQATTATPFGVTLRPTQPQTPAEQAQWEVPALNWSDLSSASLPSTGLDEPYGVSLLSDYRHGYDFQPSQLRLTLLRGAVWPDPFADCGHHTWRYSLYPHAGPQGLRTVQLGYEQHHPLRLMPLPSPTPTAALPASAQLVQLPETVILSAFKQQEVGKGYVLRSYECLGQAATGEVRIRGSGDSGDLIAMDLLELPAASDRSQVIPNEYEDAHYGLPPAVAVPLAKGDYRGSPICASTHGIGISQWRPWEIKTLGVDAS
ncbi:MAG: alpha-mannosidase [Cyanobacteria bacterium P01_A01_bin.135]